MLYERAKISNETATMLFMVHAQIFDIDFSNIVCSKATIGRRRHIYQEQEANRMFGRFNRECRYTLHCDGKTFMKRGHKDKRIGVVVTNRKVCKTLDVAYVASGQASGLADTIWATIEKWGVQKCIDSFCFDTENTNSGTDGGVVTLLGTKLGHNILRFACRRHVLELILKTVSQNTVEKNTISNSPTIPMFEKFCVAFHSSDIDRLSYDGIEGDSFFDTLLSTDEKNDLISFCEQQLQCIQHIRNDYNELLKLIIILLSPKDRNHFTIQAPGSYSRARYMCRMLYSFKMYSYRRQIKLTCAQLDGIRRFMLFVFKAYVKSWYTANLPFSAPRNDLARNESMILSRSCQQPLRPLSIS